MNRDGPRADGREEPARLTRGQDEAGRSGWLLEQLKERIRCFGTRLLRDEQLRVPDDEDLTFGHCRPHGSAASEVPNHPEVQAA